MLCADFSACVASVTGNFHLQKTLDWDNDGVGKDLNAIAHRMLNWEEDLSADLGLSCVDIHDIKELHTKCGLRRLAK